jgi:hypothetical protein
VVGGRVDSERLESSKLVLADVVKAAVADVIGVSLVMRTVDCSLVVGSGEEVEALVTVFVELFVVDTVDVNWLVVSSVVDAADVVGCWVVSVT